MGFLMVEVEPLAVGASSTVFGREVPGTANSSAKLGPCTGPDTLAEM